MQGSELVRATEGHLTRWMFRRGNRTRRKSSTRQLEEASKRYCSSEQGRRESRFRNGLISLDDSRIDRPPCRKIGTQDQWVCIPSLSCLATRCNRKGHSMSVSPDEK